MNISLISTHWDLRELDGRCNYFSYTKMCQQRDSNMVAFGKS